MALPAGAEGAPACSHATATPIRTTSPAPSPNVFIAPPRYRVCRMPLEDRGFSRAGGARALGWSRELGGTTRARLEAGSAAEPVKRETGTRGDVTPGDLERSGSVQVPAQLPR